MFRPEGFYGRGEGVQGGRLVGVADGGGEGVRCCWDCGEGGERVGGEQAREEVGLGEGEGGGARGYAEGFGVGFGGGHCLGDWFGDGHCLGDGCLGGTQLAVLLVPSFGRNWRMFVLRIEARENGMEKLWKVRVRVV